MTGHRTGSGAPLGQRAAVSSARWLSATVLVALAMVLVPATALGFVRAFDETEVDRVSGVFVQVVVLQPGNNLLWTEDLVPAWEGPADPVMHLLEVPQGGHPVDPLINVSNDDCPGGWPGAGLNPCLIVYNGESFGRPALVWVHGYSTSRASTGKLRVVNGLDNLTFEGTFGGHIITASGHDIGWNAQDRIQVVRPVTSLPPNTSYHLLAIRAPFGSCGYNDVRIANGTWASGPPGGTSMTMDWSSSSYCQVRLVIGHTGPHVMNHRARVYVNDFLHADSDGDGLGDLLEAELGTCVSQQQVALGECGGQHTTNARDTDGDGLEDGWEVLGTGVQRFPAWGADPLHKDVFVEIDWNDGLPGNPMTAFGLLLTWLPFQGGTAASMDNPSGHPGLRVHMDVGFSACNANGFWCSDVYGDWGGAGPVPENDYQVAHGLRMAAARRGLFFYGLMSDDTGGQAHVGLGAFWVGAAGQSGTELSNVTAHELGHLVGLQHWGDRHDARELLCKPTYESLMSYAFVFPPALLRFSTGSQPSVVSTNLDETSNPGLNLVWLETVFGFDVDHQTTEVDWNRDGVISGSPVTGVTRRSIQGDNCATSELHKNEVFSNLNPERVPALVDFEGELHAFFVDNQDELWHTTFAHTLEPCGPAEPPPGCCPTGSTKINVCSAWTTPTLVPATEALTSSPAAVVVTSPTPRIGLTYRLGEGATRRYVIRSASQPGTYSSERTMALSLLDPADPLTAPLKVDPVLVYRPYPVIPSTSRLQLYYLGPFEHVRQANLQENYENRGPVVVDRDTVSGGQWLTSEVSVGATRFVPSSGTDTVRVVTLNDGQLSLYLAQGSEHLTHIPGAFAASIGSVPTRRPTIIQEFEITGGLEVFFRSNSALRRTWAPKAHAPSFILARNILDGPHGDRPGAGLAIYQGRLQAASPCPGCASASNPLQHFPFASGVFPMEEEDNDDFASMAAHLCDLLRRSATPTTCQPCVAPGDPCPSPLTYPEEITCNL